MDLAGLFVVTVFLFLAFMTDVVDPIRNQFSKLGNRKHSIPLVQQGLIQSEDEFFGLEYYLRQKNYTLEEFTANGVPLHELKTLDAVIDSSARRQWSLLEQIMEIESGDTDKDLLVKLRMKLAEEESKSRKIKDQQWGNLNKFRGN